MDTLTHIRILNGDIYATVDDFYFTLLVYSKMNNIVIRSEDIN